MNMNLCILTLGAALLSGCSISVDTGGDWEHTDRGQSSLTVRANSDKEMSVNCADDREPYSMGGENGEPLVMGCRETGSEQ